MSETDQNRGAGTLLYQDASREVVAAFRNDPDFSFPSALENDQRFQQFVGTIRDSSSSS